MDPTPWSEWPDCFDEEGGKFPEWLLQRLENAGITETDPTYGQARAWPALMKHKKDITVRIPSAWNGLTDIEGDQVALAYLPPGFFKAHQAQMDSPGVYHGSKIAMLIFAATFERRDKIRKLIQRIKPGSLQYEVLTPGEFMRHPIELDKLVYLVIEQADLMQDTNWEDISEYLPKYTQDKQTVLVAARDRDVRHIEREFTGDHTTIHFGSASGPEDPVEYTRDKQMVFVAATRENQFVGSGPPNKSEIVVDFRNVGYDCGDACGESFDWDFVRLCVEYLHNDRNWMVTGVIPKKFRTTDRGHRVCEIPTDIRELCNHIQESPRLKGNAQRSADDEISIKMAFHRDCYFLSNDNYKDWQRNLKPEEVRRWLVKNQDAHRVGFFFDPKLRLFCTLDGL